MARPFTTLVEMLNNSLADYPAHELFGEKQADGSWKWLHYREFGDLVDQARAGLKLFGVEHGDRVGIIADNRVEWAVVAFAAYSLGAIVVPMYQAQHAEEWKFILDDCGAKVVFCATDAIVESVSGFISELHSLQQVVGFDLPEAQDASFKAFLARGKASPAQANSVTSDDIAGFIYTSGTTGNPKGVMLSHGNICSNVMAAGKVFEFNDQDVSLAFLPWAHSFGQTAELYTFIHVGVSMAINDEVPQLITNLPVIKPTVLVAVPRIFNRIYDGVNKQIANESAPIRGLFRAGISAATKKRRGESVSLTEMIALPLADKLIFKKIRMKFGGRLRFVVSGSAALSKEVAEFIDALGIDVFEGYGLTETSPVVSANTPVARKIGSIGKPFPGVTVRIDTAATGDAKNGEIIVSGPNVMKGYHNRPEETAKVFCDDGAFRTGDMGYIDEEGFIFITGRIKEQYKLENGKYVVPSPLEEQLKLSPYIANVMLHGANHPHNVALVVPDLIALKEFTDKQGLSMDNAASENKVIELLQAELDKYGEAFKHYERPKRILVTLEDFSTQNGQLTPSMKIKRRAVLAAYGEALEQLYH